MIGYRDRTWCSSATSRASQPLRPTAMHDLDAPLPHQPPPPDYSRVVLLVCLWFVAAVVAGLIIQEIAQPPPQMSGR